MRERCEFSPSLIFFLEGGPDRCGVILGTLPRLVPEEPREALSWAKVSWCHYEAPWREGSRGPSSCATSRQVHCLVGRGTKSEGCWDTSASSSLAYGATAGRYARLAEVSAWQRLKNGEGRKGTLAVPAISVWGGAAKTRTVRCSGKSPNHRG